MTRKILVLGIAALALGQVMTAPSAFAQKKIPPAVIAIVDVQRITQTAEAPKGIKAQIEKARAGYQQTLQGKNEQLRKLDEDLQRQRAILSPEALQQRQKEFEKKVAEAQHEVQDRRAKLEAAFGGAMQKVETAVNQIVDQIAKENGITLVLPRAAIIHASGDMDITSEVLKRLNAKLPSVAVTIPK